MATSPVERRALGLAMRHAGQAGLISPPLELRDLVDAFPYTPEQIDGCLALLVSTEGRTIGGTLDLDQLDGQWIGQLVLAGLIEKIDHDEWDLSEKGEIFSLLLDEYAHPQYLWRSQIVSPSGGAAE